MLKRFSISSSCPSSVSVGHACLHHSESKIKIMNIKIQSCWKPSVPNNNLSLTCTNWFLSTQWTQWDMIIFYHWTKQTEAPLWSKNMFFYQLLYANTSVAVRLSLFVHRIGKTKKLLVKETMKSTGLFFWKNGSWQEVSTACLLNIFDLRSGLKIQIKRLESVLSVLAARLTSHTFHKHISYVRDVLRGKRMLHLLFSICPVSCLVTMKNIICLRSSYQSPNCTRAQTNSWLMCHPLLYKQNPQYYLSVCNQKVMFNKIPVVPSILSSFIFNGVPECRQTHT